MPTKIQTQYTGVDIPAVLEGVVVRPKGEHETHDGVAFSAEVRKNGRIVGVLENTGTGGGTWFHHHTVEDMRWWDAAVEAFKPMAEFPQLANEELADVLYENAALKRDLDRKRTPIARWDGDNDALMQYGGKVDDHIRRVLAERARTEGKRVELWIKGRGWEVLV